MILIIYCSLTNCNKKNDFLSTKIDLNWIKIIKIHFKAKSLLLIKSNINKSYFSSILLSHDPFYELDL